MPSTEKETQKAILEYLTWKKIFHYRNNSGTFVRDSHMYRFGALGSPDIICVINGRYVGIEIKDKKGKQNPNQIEFQKNLEKAGGVYLLAFSVEDAIDGLKGL
jgi:hypothetical protein